MKELNKQGNEVIREFCPGDRYRYDMKLNREGWVQYDTDQDAHYFGCWVNPVKLMTFCYCEGDTILVKCADKEHYNAEIQSMNDYYGDGFVAKTIDLDGTMTVFQQDRSRFLIN